MSGVPKIHPRSAFRFKARPEDAKWHGTAGGYSNHNCRCYECTVAWRDYHREKGYTEAYRDKFRNPDGSTKPCQIAGCTRKLALSHPTTGLCMHHIEQFRAMNRGTPRFRSGGTVGHHNAPNGV